MANFSDEFFSKVEKKTNVDKDTIVSLAHDLQTGNIKDKKLLHDVISKLSLITGKDVSKDKEDKIINAIINDKVPNNMDKYF